MPPFVNKNLANLFSLSKSKQYIYPLGPIWIKPHLCIDEQKRPTPVRRQLSLDQASLGMVHPSGGRTGDWDKAMESGVIWMISPEPSVSLLTRYQFPSKSLLLAVCSACIGGTFQYGYNISIINAPTQSVQKFLNQTWLERYQTSISEQVLTLLWSTIVSIFTVGGFIGASIGGTLSIKLGRKGMLLANNVFAITAALLMGLSYPTGVFELLIIGRLLIGINAGISLCVQPLYLGEIAPTALRGAMSMGTSISITGGILTGQVIGLRELLGREEYWPILLSTSCIPAFLQLLSFPCFPESPRYLLIDKGDNEGCNNALKQLHGKDNFDIEREDMERERVMAAGVQAQKPWVLFRNHSLSWQLLTVILLNSAQQLNGINAIYFYADYVFKQSGIPDDKIPYATVGTGACECITALTCGMLIECLGRKVLITGGYALMSICCILFTLTLTFQDASPLVPYLSMACVFAFILSFGLGPGGVTNILTTELFTQTTRPAAYMIAGSVNWLSFFFIGILFPFIVTGLQQYCFLVFLVVCSLMGIYIFLVVPETKNKSFLEIHNEFQSRDKRKPLSADGPRTILFSTQL
ncbi:solute carrier family 2, facilitated glucose transporter member 11b [Diretmus argenteus]